MTVHSEDEVREHLAAHRAADRRVVFTNGAFDVLHVGHVRALEEAATLGDLLAVGVNDDASVRAARGPGRPLVPVAERMEVLAALRCVDYVFSFSDETVDRVLEALRPDVHAKGRDYATASLPERDTNQRLGIEMAFVGDEKTRSATNLVARVRALRGDVGEVRPLNEDGVRGFVAEDADALLDTTGWLDLERLATTQEGELVEGTRRRFVRRIEIAGTPVYVKVTRPAEKKRSPITEFRNHIALKAAGFLAPDPWLCMEGTVEGTRTGALVTREVSGLALDQWLREEFQDAGSARRNAWAYGVGEAVRDLHGARFEFPDLQAWHLLVDGTPAAGRGAIAFIDLMRLRRRDRPLSRNRASRGLAALALSLRPVTDTRFRLALLRGYLGGSLHDARPWLRAVGKRIDRIKNRGTFRHLGGPAPGNSA